MAVFKNGIFAYDNGKPVTPQQVGIDYSGIQTCQQFFTNGNITNIIQRSALYILVGDLQRYGLWNKMKIIYPFIGGTENSHKYNLKDPRDLDAAFRLTFNGGWTHSNNGIQGNGINTYASSYFVPSNNYVTLDAHVSFYTSTNAAGGFDLGGDDYPLQFSFSAKFSANNLAYVRLGSQQNSAISDSNGYFVNTQNSVLGMRGFRNNTSYITSAYNSGISTRTVDIGCVNDGGTRYYYSNRQYTLITIGDGLTDTEAANLYTAVQRFQTTLGRQV